MIIETNRDTSASKSLATMKSVVLGALAMAFTWGVIAGSVGLNALIKSNQEQTRLKKSVPSPTVVTINVNDVYHTGVVVTTVSALVAVLSLVSIIYIIGRSGSNLAGAYRIQASLLAFCALWLFAALIPFDYYFANHSAIVTASINGIQLPSSLINQAELALGTTAVYRKIGYLRLVAILPWFTALFAAVAAVVLSTATSRTAASRMDTEAEPVTPTDTEEMVEKDKDHDVKA